MKENGYVNHYKMKKARLEKLKQTLCKCEVCGEQANTIHHIDESNDNHEADNLIVLCHKCHRVYHSGPNDMSKHTKLYGMTLLQIAEEIKCSESTVLGYHKRGILKEILNTGKRPKSRSKFRKLYGYSLNEISGKLGISIAKVSELHELGKLKNLFDS